MSTTPIPATDEQQRLAARFAALAAADPQFRATMPDPAINAAKTQPGLGLAQIIATCMEGYAARPALAERVVEVVPDAGSGRSVRRLRPEFATVGYGELWARVRALATAWHTDPQRGLGAGDLIGILAFTGVDFATVDLAALHNGAVVVPLQTSASPAQLQAIHGEIEPAWLATSTECLATAVDLVIGGHRPRGLLLFDFDARVDDDREALAAAARRLAGAGLGDLLVTLEEMRVRGAAAPPAPVFAAPDTARRMASIYYTSGSTGAPKGAMIPENMLKPMWSVVAPLPFFSISFMPLNHTSGRSALFAALGCGGVCHFTARRDLSTLFDDIRVARPTNLTLVPRVCEMIYQQFQVELERRRDHAADLAALEREIMAKIRDELLGGRVLSVHYASAPLAAELRRFMEECLGLRMNDSYGATEMITVTVNNRVQRPPVIDYRLDDVPELGYFRTDKPHPRGELCVKSDTMMLGYYKRPDVTAQVFDADGYYRTGDIMAEIAPDQLVYLDRRNNVLKLAQGEFVAIAHLEALYTNGHPAIRQAYLYGNSERAFLLGVLVPDRELLRDKGVAGDPAAIKALLREAVDAVARAEGLAACEVPRDFIVEHEPFSAENGLLAGIGKYQRPKFRERYAGRLERMYGDIDASRSAELEALRRHGRDAPLTETVAHAARAILGIEHVALDRPASFAALGGDSLTSLAFSQLLEEIYGIEVPVSVITSPAGSLQQLAAWIAQARAEAGTRATFAAVHGRGATTIRAADLTLERFIDADTLARAGEAAAPSQAIGCVLLTGATGYLGRFLCLEWLERMAAEGGTVICIARGEDTAAARRRIAAVFAAGDPELERHFERLAGAHLEVLAGDMDAPRLGLTATDWDRLARTVDLIVHPAALVNHVLPYEQLFGPNVTGTAELLCLALTHRRKRFVNVSTMGAAILADGTLLDEDGDVRLSTPLRRLDASRYADGYANSKWAAEVLLREAHQRFGLPVSVFRCDMILAHSRYRGQINVPDMFTRWLLSVVLTGLAPRSFHAADTVRPHYDGLPVDFTARAIATIGAATHEGFHTYHVVNPHDDGISLDSFVDWAIEAGHAIRRIEDYDDWYRRFGTALRALPEQQRQHSSLPLLHQFRQPLPAQLSGPAPAPAFVRAVNTYRVGGDQGIPHLSREFITKCLADIALLGLGIVRPQAEPASVA